ncbi:MAG TPA: restriction endonuclease subunit S, partial [Rubrivivax sp.]|nr:restriction endonuclease subunit S [Burkholderiaceae bacterium]HRY88931.1 restriction endonuclease subunit S [Rubrivivax sp.]HRZ61106.1 restriction endonuclease subunit S [Rubrivivax sp.]
ANNQRRIALLEGMAEEIYREWFVRMRFPGAQRTAVTMKRPFDDLCLLSRGFDLPDADMQPGDVPVVASTSIKGYHNVAKVQPPVVTTGRSGSLGTVLLVNESAWPLNTALYVKDFRGNSPYVVFFTLKNLHLENFNAGAGVPTLNRNHLAGIRVFIPPKEIQQAFDRHVEPMLKMAEDLRDASQLLASQRDALLPRLISGKLKVDHLDIRLPPSMRAEDEAAEATA